jgi:hypothetical protein
MDKGINMKRVVFAHQNSQGGHGILAPCAAMLVAVCDGPIALGGVVRDLRDEAALQKQ